MVVALDSPQPIFTLPHLEAIPDVEDDRPQPGAPIPTSGPMRLPEMIFGAASFSHQYNNESHLASDVPLRTVRLALRYGINAFDTSAFYGPSEIVLGAVLKALEPEFPRSSYLLMTKCGRYGPTKADFDYSPTAIRAGVNRSLGRLNTTYLDTVYLHDVEFVCENVQPRTEGNHLSSLTTEREEYGLSYGEESRIWGEGDQRVLDAISELRKMKEEGLIKNVGMTGYPLPTLLRIALLVLHTPPYQPLDVLLSYSHLNLQNSTFEAFVREFRLRAQIPELVAASPLNMGLLTRTPPTWHPATPEIKDAARRSSEICVRENWGGGLPNIALGFAYHKARELGLPTVIGLSQLREVHENVKVWRELRKEGEEDTEKRTGLQSLALEEFESVLGWSWPSP